MILAVRVYYGGGFGVEDTQVPLIPRSLFFQSELYHRLNQTDNLDAGPILGNAKVVWRDMGEDNQDAITVYLDGDPPVYSLEASRRGAGVVHGESAKGRYVRRAIKGQWWRNATSQ